MKFLIAGLGNPGAEYRNTRHNVGFEILDVLAGASGIFFSEDRLAQVAELKYKGRTLILIKPQTFMNLSGKATNYWLQKEKIEPSNMLVVTDDIAIPFGALRLRAKGSDGGHNGLKNIIFAAGTTEFPRLRFGVGADFPKGRQADYLLSPWSAEEKNQLPPRLTKAADAILSYCFAGLQETMNRFNGN